MARIITSRSQRDDIVMSNKFDHYNEKTNFSYAQFQKSLSSQDVSRVSTSFDKNLEYSILELVSDLEVASLRQVTDKYGDFKQVHQKIKEMLLEGKILTYESELEGDQYEKQKIKIVDYENTFWDSMNAQPCLTCPILSECGIENPVSPAMCDDFAEWLEAEIKLDMAEGL